MGYLDDFTTVVTRNSGGQIKSIDGPNGRSEYRSYEFFGLDKILDETGHVFVDYNYDFLGRVSSEESDGTAFLYDYLDRDHTRITTSTEEIDAYYDRIGQLESFTDTGGSSTLTYDGLGRTRQAVYDDGGDLACLSFEHWQSASDFSARVSRGFLACQVLCD